jgi:hypothetical protein
MSPIAKSGGLRWIARAIRRLTRLAENWEIDVAFEELDGISGMFVPSEMTIYMDARLKGRDRVNYLLHELGHASIHIDGLTRDRFNVFDTDATTPRERLTLVEEEFEAWHRGRAIARHAGIKLDDSYELARERSMMSYLRWCVSDGQINIGKLPDRDGLRVGSVRPTTSVEVADARHVDGLSAGHVGVHGLVGLGSDPDAQPEGEARRDDVAAGPGGGPLLEATVPEGMEEAGQGEAKGSCTSDADGQQPERPLGDEGQGASPAQRRNALRLRGL